MSAHNALRLSKDIEAIITAGGSAGDAGASKYSEPKGTFPQACLISEIKNFSLKEAEMKFLIAKNTLLDSIYERCK
jgi:hypothetical protein